MSTAFLTVNRTLWIDGYSLEWGVYTVGGAMSFCTIWYMFWPDINWADWLFFLFAATPMTAMFITLLVKRDRSQADITAESAEYLGYIKSNWYFTFFAWCIATIQVIAQTIILALALGQVGSGSIVFRGGY